MDVGWTACGQTTLSHCIPIPNSEHGLEIEKNLLLVLILGLGLFPPFFWFFGIFP
jgi:hypothetical protein